MYNHNNANELYHWKYIRRERVNGKWRYYYAKDEHRLSVGRVSKDKLGYSKDAYGAVHVKKDGHITTEIVDKKEYRKTDTGYKFYVGSTPLKEIRTANLKMAKQFVDDLITNGLYKEKKKK
jgi:hypothetical protein